MKPIQQLFIAILLLLTSHTIASNAQTMSLPDEKTATIGVCVLDIESGRVTVSYNDTLYFTPASTQKVITTAASLLCRGSNYRFETIAGYDGKIDKKGRLHGDIIIHGKGDPSLESQYGGMPVDSFIRATVSKIIQSNIRHISGQIIADDRAIYPEPVVSKWLWEDVGNYYAAGCYGINYADNRFTVTYHTQEPNTRPIMIGVAPEIEGLKIYNYISTNASGIDSAYIYGSPYEYTRRVYGSLPAHRNRFSIKGDIPDPPYYLATLLSKALSQAGIQVEGTPTTARILLEEGKNMSNKHIVPLYIHQSVPLIDIIRHTLTMSDNLYAESLLRNMALVTDSIATLSKGIEQMKALCKKAGFTLSGATLYDGSGLSPLNRITPRMMAQMLAHIARTPELGENFIHAFPHPGEGTLRRFMHDSPLASHLWLKSGSMTATQCYAGYYTPGIGTYAVVIMVNNFSISRKEVISSIEKILSDILPNQ